MAALGGVKGQAQARLMARLQEIVSQAERKAGRRREREATADRVQRKAGRLGTILTGGQGVRDDDLAPRTILG